MHKILRCGNVGTYCLVVENLFSHLWNRWNKYKSLAMSLKFGLLISYHFSSSSWHHGPIEYHWRRPAREDGSWLFFQLRRKDSYLPSSSIGRKAERSTRNSLFLRKADENGKIVLDSSKFWSANLGIRFWFKREPTLYLREESWKLLSKFVLNVNNGIYWMKILFRSVRGEVSSKLLWRKWYSNAALMWIKCPARKSNSSSSIHWELSQPERYQCQYFIF